MRCGLLLLFLLVAPACGRDDDPLPEAAAPRTPSEAYVAHLDAEEVAELAPLARQRATLQVLADRLALARDAWVEVALVGNLQSYFAPCSCSAEARTGGLAYLAGALRAVRRGDGAARRHAVMVGNSLAPPEGVPSGFDAVYRDKVEVAAEALRAMEAGVFCPGASDLAAFADRADFLAWLGRAGATCVVSNVQEETAAVRRSVVFPAGERGIGVFCVLPNPQRQSVLACDDARTTIARIETAAASLAAAIVVVHGPRPDALVERFPTSLRNRCVFVTTEPRVRLLAPWALTPVARGQSVDVVQFLLPTPAPASLQNAGRWVQLLEEHRVAGRAVEPERFDWGLDRPKFAFATYHPIALTPELENRLEPDRKIEARLADVDRAILAPLVALPAWLREEVPEPLEVLLPEACASCHPREVEAWRRADPHRHALRTALETESRPPSFSCVRCHLTGMWQPTADSIPVQSEVWKLRRLLGGIGCVTCHTAAGPHLRAEGALPAGDAPKTCVLCHDAANSPEFEYEKYKDHLACCGK